MRIYIGLHIGGTPEFGSQMGYVIILPVDFFDRFCVIIACGDLLVGGLKYKRLQNIIHIISLRIRMSNN